MRIYSNFSNTASVEQDSKEMSAPNARHSAKDKFRDAHHSEKSEKATYHKEDTRSDKCKGNIFQNCENHEAFI